MPYYHVIVRPFGSKGHPRCIIADASEKELRSKFVRHYRAGKNILLGSELFRMSEIRTVLIVRTERPEADERADINDADLKEIERLNAQSDGVVILSPGRGYEPEDILEAGEDVTSEYIKGPPGNSPLDKLRGALHNPWVVGIGTAVFAAALIAWIGLSGA